MYHWIWHFLPSPPPPPPTTTWLYGSICCHPKRPHSLAYNEENEEKRKKVLSDLVIRRRKGRWDVVAVSRLRRRRRAKKFPDQKIWHTPSYFETWHIQSSRFCCRKKQGKPPSFLTKLFFCGKQYFGHSFFPKMPIYLPLTVCTYAVKKPIFCILTCGGHFFFLLLWPILLPVFPRERLLKLGNYEPAHFPHSSPGDRNENSFVFWRGCIFINVMLGKTTYYGQPRGGGGGGGGRQQIASYQSAAAEVEAGEDMSYPVAHSSVGCLVKGGLFIDLQTTTSRNQGFPFGGWKAQATSTYCTTQFGKANSPTFPCFWEEKQNSDKLEGFFVLLAAWQLRSSEKKRFFCLDRELTMICPRKKNPRSVRQQRRTDGSLNLGGSKPVFAQKSVTKKGNKLEKQGRMRRTLHDSVALYSSLHFFAKRLFRKQVVIIFSSPLVCQKEKRNIMWWPWLGLQRWNMGEERRVLKCNSKNRTCNIHPFPAKKERSVHVAVRLVFGMGFRAKICLWGKLQCPENVARCKWIKTHPQQHDFAFFSELLFPFLFHFWWLEIWPLWSHSTLPLTVCVLGRSRDRFDKKIVPEKRELINLYMAFKKKANP